MSCVISKDLIEAKVQPITSESSLRGKACLDKSVIYREITPINSFA